jgi:hypothetical protein
MGERRRAKRWRGRLTMEQIYALRRYAGSAFAVVNAALRESDDPRFAELAGEELEKGRTISEVLGEIDPIRLTRPTTVWRGAALPRHLLTRGRWTDPAWVSCSFDPDHARYAAQSSPENARGAVLEIQLDAGCEYLPLSYALSGDDEIANEHEILLLPGHRFQALRDGERVVLRCWKPWKFE